MRKIRVLLAVIVVLLASLACQTIMGGGNGLNLPGSNGTAPTLPPVTTDGGNITVGGASPFPVPSDATNVVSTSISVTYQTKLSSSDVIKFYQDEFGKKGYTEDKTMEMNSNGTFTMTFTGYNGGKKIAIGGVSTGSGVTAVTVAVE